MFRFFSYYSHKFANWAVLAGVVILFFIGMQVVYKSKALLGLAPAPTVRPATTAGPVTTPPPAGVSPAPVPATANTNSPLPVVPAGPTPAEIRATLQEARDRLVESGVHVDAALKSISAWKTEIPPLLKTEAGNNIAAREDLVVRLTKIVNEERTSEGELRYAAKRIGALRSQLGKRTTSSSPTPLTPREHDEIDGLYGSTRSADEEWSEALKDARAVKVLGDEGITPIQELTLEQKVEIEAAKQQLAESEERKRREEQRKAQEAEYQREQKRVAAEREREKERLAAKRKEEAEAAAEKRRLEEEALLERARSTEVQSALAIFLHKRDSQPRKAGPGSVNFRSTFDSAPMSLSALKGIGALEPTTEGLKWLARVGGSRKLSSPRWGVASQPGNRSEDDKKLLKEAQGFLREFGPILVKDG
ncbi:MAG: hypothetical protein KDB27_25745, partial [Planctomycetales bacterium]|nr:hypothetical protein [Planctomycetales bacterium]